MAKVNAAADLSCGIGSRPIVQTLNPQRRNSRATACKQTRESVHTVENAGLVLVEPVDNFARPVVVAAGPLLESRSRRRSGLRCVWTLRTPIYLRFCVSSVTPPSSDSLSLAMSGREVPSDESPRRSLSTTETDRLGAFHR
jgi:hypothetical protein